MEVEEGLNPLLKNITDADRRNKLVRTRLQYVIKNATKTPTTAKAPKASAKARRVAHLHIS